MLEKISTTDTKSRQIVQQAIEAITNKIPPESATDSATDPEALARIEGNETEEQAAETPAEPIADANNSGVSELTTAAESLPIHLAKTPPAEEADDFGAGIDSTSPAA